MLTEVIVRHRLQTYEARLAELTPIIAAPKNLRFVIEHLTTSAVIAELTAILELPATPQRLPDGPDTADADQH